MAAVAGKAQIKPAGTATATANLTSAPNVRPRWDAYLLTHDRCFRLLMGYAVMEAMLEVFDLH